MADDLRTVVQRMIDAGEPEDNIATVIQHFSRTPDPAEVAAHGDQIVPPGGVQHEPDTWWGGFGKSIKDQVLGATVGNPLLQGAAHPKEPGDFLGLLVPNGVEFGAGARSAAASAAPAVTKAGVALEKTGAYLDPRAKYLAAGAALHGNLPTAAGVLTVPKGLQSAGRGLQNVGQMMTKTDAVERFSPNIGADWSAVDHSVAPGEISPEVAALSRPAGAAAPAAKPTSTSVKVANRGMQSSGRLTYQEAVDAGLPENILKNYPEHAAAAQRDSLLQELSPVGTPAPTPELVPQGGEGAFNATRPTPKPPDPEETIYKTMLDKLAERPELQQPRVEQGAERVGRAEGLSKQDVRDQTAPVLGEAPGEASPVLPQNVFEGIYDKMRGLPRDGQGRIDYVAAARDPKTRAQLETLRRTLERSGLLAVLGVSGAAATAKQ